MRLYAALFLAVCSGGRIDYLPGARRPWVVCLSRNRKIGRGSTLARALYENIWE